MSTPIFDQLCQQFAEHDSKRDGSPVADSGLDGAGHESVGEESAGQSDRAGAETNRAASTEDEARYVA